MDEDNPNYKMGWAKNGLRAETQHKSGLCICRQDDQQYHELCQKKKYDQRFKGSDFFYLLSSYEIPPGELYSVLHSRASPGSGHGDT